MDKEKIVDQLLLYLEQEDKRYQPYIPSHYEEKRKLLRSLVNLRPPEPIDEHILKLEDELLQLELKEKKITSVQDIPFCEEPISIWLGDITTLSIDAIVNAGNSSLLGCFIPGHHCIDNAIHTYAGMRLRLACNELMQGREEGVGNAKITKAYNLPSQYVIHTVGPMIIDEVTEEDIENLKKCYRSSLELASQNGIRSIAFPTISTGVFHFPKELASKIAVSTVREYIAGHPGQFDHIVFNVFTKEDQFYYDRSFKN